MRRMKAIKRYLALLLIFVCLFIGCVLLACEQLAYAFVSFAAGITLTNVFDNKHLLPE